jgi:hypothetical protein
MSKKGAKAQPKEQSYEIRDVVLAKVRGYPPWPGIVSGNILSTSSESRDARDINEHVSDGVFCFQVVDPDSVPKNVTKERPNGKSKKGNWYCVRFFPAGD